MIVFARRLLDSAGLQWKGEKLLEVSPEVSTITFTNLRALEEIEIFVESFPLSPHLQSPYDEGGAGEVEVGGIVVLRVPRQIRTAVIVKDLKELLSIPAAAHTVPDIYLLTHTVSGEKQVFSYSCASDLNGAPEIVARYHAALGIWSLLVEQAQHETSADSLLFFGIRRIEICPGFSINDIAEELAEADIRKFISNKDREETRKEIFASALSEFLRDQNPGNAFSYLLRESHRFARRLREGLALFLSEHSPEKLTEEARAKHFDLAEKLERTVSSIELKSLSIPVSLLLVAKEVQIGANWTVTNTTIFVAVIVYLIAMTIAHSSHLTRLRLLWGELYKAVCDLKRQGLEDDNPVLSQSFRTLRNRVIGCYVGAWISWTLSVGPLIAVIFTMFIT